LPVEEQLSFAAVLAALWNQFARGRYRKRDHGRNFTGDDPGIANRYVQIPIAAGTGYARNIAVVHSARL